MKAIVLLEVQDNYDFVNNSRVLVQNGKPGSAVYGIMKPMRDEKDLQAIYDEVFKSSGE